MSQFPLDSQHGVIYFALARKNHKFL